MYSSKEFLSLLEEFAPLSLSRKMIEKGSYDNSGLLVKNHDNIQKIVFTLDLTVDAVLMAESNGCDTIVTHHPAIYSPISSLDFEGDTAALTLAVKKGFNVYSMHLNLDIADKGIDQCLSDGLGLRNTRVIDKIYGDLGYGRIGEINSQKIEKFAQQIKEQFGSDKIIFYGNNEVKCVASFCGAGASSAVDVLKELGGVDTVVTSDIAHHNLLSIVNAGKNVVIIPHYVAENYGFNKFYQSVCQKLCGGAKGYYFTDKRFM